MEKRPDALLLKFPGTNCGTETARALREVGFSSRVVPITQVTTSDIESSSLIVFSGGFSYGDYVMAGRFAQLVSQQRLGNALEEFIERGGYALGICNGFQILTKLGLLPGGSLIDNTSGRFICRWTKLVVKATNSPFLKELPLEFELPVAHAEGRFVAKAGQAQEYLDAGLVALTYGDDLNGSTCGIAGLQNSTGRVMGLMPHPERFLYREHHYDPDWNGDLKWGWGYYFFKSIQNEICGVKEQLIA